MKKIRPLLYTAAAIIVLPLLLWYFSVPEKLIEEKIKRSISRSIGSNIRTEITGLSKGLLFQVYFDRINIYMDTVHALTINDISVQMNPLYIYRKNIEFTLNGSIGTGDIKGTFLFPDGGTFSAERIDIASISYLKSSGMEISGYLSAGTVFNNSSSETRFTIDELNIKESPISMIPLISSFSRSQGMLTTEGNKLTINSLSLDGEKAYARVKGKIINGSADITFELMPEFCRLEEFEKILIKKYESSPGYYVIPFRGRLPI